MSEYLPAAIHPLPEFESEISNDKPRIGSGKTKGSPGIKYLYVISPAKQALLLSIAPS
jgi:hypothetical protein